MKQNNSFRFAWLGFHFEGLPALQRLVSENQIPQAIITLTRERMAKRSGGVDLEAFGIAHGIPVYHIENVNDDHVVELLKSLNLDVLFVIGWSQIVRSPALSTVRIGMIGAHASLLPHNRGSAPINWAIIKGESYTGNSLIWLADSVDAGDIIDQKSFKISPYDTCETLYCEVAKSNAEMISNVIPRLEKGEMPCIKQELTSEEILPRRRPSDGVVDWSGSALQVYNFIRALSRPYPGAFSYMDGKCLRIWRSSLLPGNPYSEAQAGSVIGPVFSPDEASCGLVVACRDGAILIHEVEDEEGVVIYGRSVSELDWVGRNWENKKNE
ncbi:MAG: methionyl-tRNA formyltransferase [Deltaproteobacteria bacterium]|nr:methionyl-tRNA formyltransferase [Deltaproteobacteria bacterium]